MPLSIIFMYVHVFVSFVCVHVYECVCLYKCVCASVGEIERVTRKAVKKVRGFKKKNTTSN